MFVGSYSNNHHKKTVVSVYDSTDVKLQGLVYT